MLLALDIGNVCVTINHENCFRGLGMDAAPAGMRELLRRYECGEMDDGDFIRYALELTGGKFTGKEFLDAFRSVLIAPVPGMAELVSAFPAMGIKAVFFSDISPIHLRRTEELFPAFHAVSGGVYSFKTGAWKPAPGMFRCFEKQHGRPDLYVDDRSELIEAARQWGWNGEIFTSAADLQKKLASLS